MSFAKKLGLWVLLAVMIGAVVACDVFDDDDDATGNVAVMIHDAPSDEMKNVYVTFSALEMLQVGGDWVSASGPFPLELDLLALVNGNEALLGADQFPEGSYSSMRVTMSGVRVILLDDSEINLPLPNGEVTTEVANFPVLVVTEGDALTVTIDFPVDTSFQINGADITFSPNITYESTD